MTLRSKTLTVSIESPPERVYAFVSNPENLPKWATAFCRSVRRSEGDWIVETPDGPMRIRFVGHNEYGVLDHYVYPRPGLEILNPMRVIPNGSESEIIFTLFQSPTMSDEKFAEDVTLVERDLRALKNVLEG
ncbi:MAG: polyketide cyclase [Deltaproteobacteria bacterium RIFCSPLOWO2_12_FULL_43_16]|nr:MAG: polyketide cyclase [Deltaproteobacteria bacterium GWA2_43_19]OGQ09453.1 MAG: polyketide cyclase [Deltaproteobacteria bacterium RIFCSPHIGHO2_02_FULL_43_33]OGQ58100.1 MAG: polyketide cyclase [Deltaproteobacteria bacterium RIFCSPLOWO2_12_FULL_43_16]